MVLRCLERLLRSGLIPRLRQRRRNVFCREHGAVADPSGALGQVDIIIEYQGRRYHGAGLATDIVRSSVLAYVHVLNLIERSKRIDAVKLARKNADSTIEK